MRNILAIAVLSLLSGCAFAPPPGSFDVRSSTNERIIGHCVTDPASVEATAYGERIQDLPKTRAENSPVPGFRALMVQQPDYQYILYAPVTASTDPYHIVCPSSGDRSSCILAGSYADGHFEAHIALKSSSQVRAAANAALAACKQ
jgi:hypothetical protein